MLWARREKQETQSLNEGVRQTGQAVVDETKRHADKAGVSAKVHILLTLTGIMTP